MILLSAMGISFFCRWPPRRLDVGLFGGVRHPAPRPAPASSKPLDSTPSCTGKAPGFLTLPTTYTLPDSGTRISSPPISRMFNAGSAASIRPRTRMRCTKAAEPCAARLGPAHQDLGSGLRAEAARPGDGFQQCDLPIAWNRIGCFTAPATEMGRDSYSAMVTVTKGSTISCSASSASRSPPPVRPASGPRP